MEPSSIHHVFPYHVDQIADGVSGWWATQKGVWPVAAALETRFPCRLLVHVIGDEEDRIGNLVVHRGTIAGSGVQQFGCDFSLSMFRAMGALGPTDVCFIHGSDSPAAAMYADAARNSRIVAVYHGGATGGRDRQKDLAARHLVLRPELTETLTGLGYASSSMVEVTPTISSAFFDVVRGPTTPGVARVGFVARPSFGKGSDSIVPTMRALGAAGYDASIEIVGNTHLDDVSVLQTEVVGAGCRFEARGFLPNDEIPAIMGKWDVLLSPSRWEGCGRSVLEAAACGVPVVCVEGVVPAKVIDGVTVLGVARDEVPDAVVAAVAGSASVPRSVVPRRHAEGAEDLDRIIDTLPLHVGRRRFSVRARLLAIAKILRHWESFRRIGRPLVRRYRSLR